MTAPAQPQALKPREVTAALRCLYPRSVPVRSGAGPDGSVLVSLGHPASRYLGIGRDSKVAANLLGWYLGRPVTIGGHEYADAARTCVFTVIPDPGGQRPVDPGCSLAVPAYTGTGQVLGGFPANRIVTGLIRLALDAGCRPHLSPWRSGHGRQYRVSLWHTDPRLLFGCIDVGEDNGRFAAAYLQWGQGPETRHADPRAARQNLISCRDQHRAGTAAADAHRLASAGFPAPAFAAPAPPWSSLQVPGSGPASRARAARTASPAQQGQPRSLR
jgi:hypothetical protein